MDRIKRPMAVSVLPEVAILFLAFLMTPSWGTHNITDCGKIDCCLVNLFLNSITITHAALINTFYKQEELIFRLVANLIAMM